MNDLLKVINEAREKAPEERAAANIEFEDIIFEASEHAEPGLKRQHVQQTNLRSLPRGQKKAAPSVAKLRDGVDGVDVPWLPQEQLLKLANLPYLTRLNLEILQYVAYCTLTEAERAAREYVLGQLRDIIQLVLPDATVDVFGSYSTGMSSYSSDLDICVHVPMNNTATMQCHMHDIATLLRRSISTNYVDVRSHARVPIIKGVHSELSLEYDISFNSPHGAAHRETILGYIEKHPLARILIMVVKSFLKKRGLNQPYTGGMSSYILLQLIVVYISERHNVFPYCITGENLALLESGEADPNQPAISSMDESNSNLLIREKRTYTRKKDPSQTSIECELLTNRFHAASLIEFFELFGTIYNAEDLTIYTNPRGNESFVSSRRTSGYYHQSIKGGSTPFLSILNSHDPTSDCAGGVTRYKYIRSSFELAYFYLLRNHSGSILSFLVEVDFTSMHTREKCKEWYDTKSDTAAQDWAAQLEALIVTRASSTSNDYSFRSLDMNEVGSEEDLGEDVIDISSNSSS
ncbi:Topoisomerase I-related protein [Giardia lamblia P15]|uniref:Topoisomerase I-related protein n=1 Tax=Giardia intestinalis (strain P15) TaxID=658858 RepID=E1EZ80_GIAIA|nr:Topoisomerase I-related protein [Giardia lamblia P15]